MATAYRSSQSVINATAGTTVVVSKPAGIVDTGANPGRDHLIAFIACTGAPTITPPAGWTLITTIASTTAVTIAAYRKLASSEGASWTWTLGTSQRNWGVVEAYTGVDPTTPVNATGSSNTLAASTGLSPSAATLLSYGQGLVASAATRAASGVATTWTGTNAGTERADLSTNAGVGTDITGVVADTAYSGLPASYLPTLTASQAQLAGVAISITLRPYFVPYDGGPLTVMLEAAFGADPDGDQTLWTWTPVTTYVLDADTGPAVTYKPGKPNATSTADAATMTFTLKNLAGEFTNPTGAYYDQLKRGLPFRLKVGGFGVVSAGAGYHRGTAFLTSAKPRWDTTLNYSLIDVVCRGRLWRTRQDTKTLHSAAYRTLSSIGTTGAVGIRPIVYHPLESDALSAVPGTPAALYSGITFASDSSFPGSAPVVRMGASSAITVITPTYTPVNDMWAYACGYMIPTEPAITTNLFIVSTNGTACWSVSLAPGASAIQLVAFTPAGATLLSVSAGLDETSFYGHPVAFTLAVTQNGAAVDYALSFNNAASSGISGTLAAVTNSTVSLTQTIFQAGLAGAGFGHQALYTGLDASGTLLLPTYVQAALVAGHAGEWPWSRFQRLCIEEDIGYTLTQSTNTALTMGPQRVDTVANLLAECEAVEGNVMHDAGTFSTSTGLLAFPAADERDNRPVDLTLSMLPGSGQVAPGFEPTMDDQGISNYVEVTNSTTGSKFVASDAASVLKEGTRKQSYTVNLQTDDFLDDIAGRYLAVGITPGFRFPNVAWNLRNANTRTLVEPWLACILGAKLAVTDPPSQYPPDDIEAFLEGYTEELGTYWWMVRGNLSPAALNNVGILSNDLGDTNALLGHLESDSVVLAAGMTTTQTSVTVTAVPLITTVADDFPVNVYAGGEEWTVTNCVGAANPQTLTMTRSVNGVVKVQTINTPVTLVHPLILTM